MTIIEKSIVVQTSLTIHASPNQTWSVFADLKHWADWNPACLNAMSTSRQLWNPGAGFRFTIKPWWHEITFQATVIECCPPIRVLWLAKGCGIYAQHTFTFEPADEGTGVTSHGVFSGPLLGLMPLYAPPARVKDSLTRWLEALKERTETG